MSGSEHARTARKTDTNCMRTAQYNEMPHARSHGMSEYEYARTARQLDTNCRSTAQHNEKQTM